MDVNVYWQVLNKLNNLSGKKILKTYGLKKFNRATLILEDAEQYFVACNDIIENDLPNFASRVQSENISHSWKYTMYLYRILTDIQQLLDQNDLSTKQTTTNDFDNLVSSIQKCSKFGLEPYLHPEMAKNKCFSAIYQSTDVNSAEECYNRLNLGINAFAQILLIKELRSHKLFEDMLLIFLAAVFSNTRNDSDAINHKLDQVYDIFQEKYFQILLILKSNQTLPVSLQKMLHRHLMKRLVGQNGFEVLCKTLIRIGDDANEPIWKLSSAVFDIVSRKGHTKEFYIAIIDGIFEFLKKCIKSKELERFVETCVGSLMRIYSLRSEEISEKIVSYLVERLDILCSPKEIFAGYIVLDSDELEEVISMNLACFCSSVHVVLPSEILVPYLRVLCQIFSQVEVTALRTKISTLIIKCLHNRGRVELKSIINSLLFEDSANHLKLMHSRIVIQLNNTSQEHKCVISKASDLSFFDASECLINILKSSNNNILAYNIFIHIFEQLDGSVNVSPQSKSDLIQDEDELTQLMSQVFKKRVAVYYTLSELINHKQLHHQINENPSEMLNICMNIIRNHLTNPENKTLNDEHSTILVLSIIKEFLEKIQFTKQFDEFIKILCELKLKSENNQIVNQINSILVALNRSEQKSFRAYDKSQFAMAKELCEESEPHLKVYGLMQFIKLIRDDKDPETLDNKHAVLAISLICLKEEDSYAFLNCIKLLIVLCDVLESVVLEMLIAEYQSTENEIDHRLKIGEVIVKVVEGLGKFCF